LGVFVLVLSVVIVTILWALDNLEEGQHWLASLAVLWILVAYYVLPRAHRLLSKLYVPSYFIGRARTADGLLADPVNMAIRASQSHLVSMMKRAGWSRADPITFKTAIAIIKSTLLRQSYQTAPVSDLFVYGKKQDLAFQKEVNGNPAKRHHVRFWKVEKGVYLPGGYTVDWVGAATYDDAVGFSLFTLQITHRIDGDVDAERDFLVNTLESAQRDSKVQRIEGFFPEYTHRNGGGDSFFTDGSMVIIDLKGDSTA